MDPLPGPERPQLHEGLALARANRPAEAIPLLQLALVEEAPEHVEARLALADCLLETGDPNRAIQQLRRVLRLDPACFGAYERLAALHRTCGHHEALKALLDAWILQEPERPELRWERGTRQILDGRYAEGWEALEARFQVKGRVISQVGPFSQPAWDGRPFPGRTLLLHWEQGLGDTLMFIRFAALAKARGGRVVAVVQPPLVHLLRTCPGLDEVLADGTPLPSFDLQLPLMSLPRVLGLHAEADLPREIPYLEVPAQVPGRERIRALIPPTPDQVRIGYVWAGGSAYLNDAARSLPPDELAPLAALPGVAWFCFQVPRPDSAPLPSVLLGGAFSDFADTAFALAHMDLLITVDTSIAHLAGALGLPTFLLLNRGADWRWGLEGEATPWYPTFRLYRQPAPGDWKSVIQHLLRDLAGDQPGR